MAVWVLWFCPLGASAIAGEYASGMPVGQITETNLAEVSGIAASRQNPGVLWIHNDRARDQVFAVSTNGQLLATWTLGSEVSDFEDIAIGPGPQPDLQYIYCGDIGDNSATRSSIRVYRAAEPAVYAYQAREPMTAKFPSVEKFTLTYPDGAHNAEALLVDPWTREVLVATKESGNFRIYRAEPSQLHDGTQVTLSFVTEVGFDIVSAGDISPDGHEILLRQEEFARIWRRSAGQSIAEALAGTPTDVPVIGMPTEPNGEGVAFVADGRGYFTISEGTRPLLYFFAKTNNVRAPTTQTLVAQGSQWKFQDGGSDQQAAWTSPDFNDASWKTGCAQFGYGEGDEHTEISFGEDKDRKHVTTYFRNEFRVSDASVYGSLVIRALYDDGLAVYLNGVELFRTNLAVDASFSEPALASASSQENLWHTVSVTNLLRTGSNTLAAEVHRFSRSEGDLSFDLQLLATSLEPELRFTGPPQMLAGGTWFLSFSGSPAAVVLVQRSTDLRHWVAVGSVVLTNGTGSITAAPSASSLSFFRLGER